MKKKIKLVWVSDHPCFKFVGQSRVTREYCSRLLEEPDFDLVVLGFVPPSLKEKAIKYQFPCRVVSLPRGNHEDLMEKVKAENPDVIILSHDCWMFPNIAAIRENCPNAKILGYFTIDGEPAHRLWKQQIFDYCDLIISPTEYGRRVIQDKYFDVKIEVIPYGINHKLFYVVGAKEEMKQSVVVHKDLIDLGGKFLVIFVGQNQSRKNLGVIYQAWEQFEKSRKDVILFLLTHSHQIKRDNWILPADYDLMSLFGTSRTVAVFDAVVDDVIIAKLMMASDIFLSPGSGEGFGLPILEAMACQSIPIVTNYAGVTDFVNDENSFCLPWIPFLNPEWCVIRAIVRPDDLVKALTTSYDLWKQQDKRWGELQKNASETAARFDWNKSAKKLIEVIRQVISQQAGKYRAIEL